MKSWGIASRVWVMNFKKLLLSLRRKSRRAWKLGRQGNWSEFGQKVVRNFADPARGFLSEAYGLSRDCIAHRYWRWRYRNSQADPAGHVSFSVEETTERRNAKKNVIWIMLDALRADIFAAFMQRGGMSSLAYESVSFPRAFAQGSWTYPSVFSFLTGRYPFNCGVSKLIRGDGMYASLCADFDESCPTVFSLLRQNGYQVGSILDGWGYTVRNTAGQEHREDRYFEDNWGWFYGQNRRFLTLEEQRDASVRFIDRAAAQGPFMLFLRSLYTHSPYRDIFKSSKYVTTLSRRRWRFRLFEGFIRGMQRFETVYMRSILATLEKLDQLDNTIIVLSSDHGDMFWDVEEDLRRETITDEEVWRHQLEPYNGLIKVPLLIWGGRARGVYPDRFRLVDIVPTLLDEVGIGYDPAAFDGLSLFRDGSRPLYADSSGYGNGGIAFQEDGAKLLMSRRLGPTAYDISPDEYERLAQRRQGHEEMGRLIDFVETTSRQPGTIIEPAGSVDAGESETDSHEDTLHRRLRALGYL